MTTIQIKLSDAAERAFSSRSARTGKPVESLIEEVVEREANVSSWAEMAAPIREAMAGHGMTDDELLAFFESERQAMRDERETNPTGHGAGGEK